MNQNGVAGHRHGRSLSYDRFIGVFSPPSETTFSSSPSAVTGGELNEDDVFYNSDFSERQQRHHHLSGISHSLSRSEKFGILAALPELQENLCGQFVVRKPALPLLSRAIPSIPKPLSSLEVKYSQSLPVNVPMFPRRCGEVSDFEGDDDEMLPPHEIVARGSSQNQKNTFSVLEGVGERSREEISGRCAMPCGNKQEKMQTTNSSVEEDMFQVRKLEITDKNKGFIELLQQLTVCDPLSDEAFEERFHELAKCGDEHVICVIEDYNSGKIVAIGSVFIEKKFIRNCGKVGHIEDVVVDSVVRGKQLGKRIVDFLSDHARAMGCYKVILDCSVENIPFYEKCGFKKKEIQMVKYHV